MRAELDKKLCETYPGLYRNRHTGPQQSSMAWGFACGDGWYDLIDVLSDLLTKHDPNIVASQVKEKFGGLRFYYGGKRDSYCDGAVGMAEAFSMISCDECGAPAKTGTQMGYVSTRCSKHARTGPVRDKIEYPTELVHGVGFGWSRLVTMLEDHVAWHTEKNRITPAMLRVEKVDNRLNVTFIGGDERTRGMVDFVNNYALRIDEETGDITRTNT